MKVFKYLSGLNKNLLIFFILIGIHPLFSFDFSDILFWVGEGENQAALVIDWQDGKEPQSLLWGFRWSGTATGQDLINAVVQADNRLSGDVDALVSQVYYDINNNQFIDDNDHNINYSLFPNNYWSYWVKQDSGDNWGYSNNGIAGRELSNGCCDAWVFVEDWEEEHSEPTLPIPAPPETIENNFIEFSDIAYWIGEGENQAMLVIDWNDESQNPSLAWGYKWNGTANATDMINQIAEIDIRLEANLSSGFLDNLIFTVDGEVVNSGIGGDPDWWSTWSRRLDSTWSMNGGVVTALNDGDVFGCSYGFSPATEPDLPLPVEAIEPPIDDLIANNVEYRLRNGVTHILNVTKNDSYEVISNINLVSVPENITTWVDTLLNVCITTTEDVTGDFDIEYQLVYDNLVSNIATVRLSLLNGFSGAVGSNDNEAIANTDNRIIAWATGIEIQRGYVDIRNRELGFVEYGEIENAIGFAEGNSMNVISLGDSGIVTASFEGSILNGEGPDFAIFENGINDFSLELAFVEVSSDGTNFVRFPAVSLTQCDTQVGNAGPVDPRDIHNLAGKYRAGYGTPFDLEELSDSLNIDINNITNVRVIDVVGSILPEYASSDIYGNIINDPFPTPFASSGFDLDGIGVFYMNTTNISEGSINKTSIQLHSAYPNPFNPTTTLSFTLPEPSNVLLEIFNVKGQKVKTLANDHYSKGTHNFIWEGTNDQQKTLTSGMYFYRLKTNDKVITKKMMLIK
ncbi:MAG: T9SS type A sorting domain-containing protein [Candidatus Cloacimonetes bacterium]|nr:T9SS type A sorting domain-containing protein [Candidatus Cloacimonadota bacterium]